MSVFPQPPDTWSRSLFRILLAADVVFILFRLVVEFGAGPYFYLDREPMDWEQFCRGLVLCTGIFVIICSYFFRVRKPVYGSAGLTVGLISIYAGMLDWPNIK